MVGPSLSSHHRQHQRCVAHIGLEPRDHLIPIPIRLPAPGAASSRQQLQVVGPIDQVRFDRGEWPTYNAPHEVAL